MTNVVQRITSHCAFTQLNVNQMIDNIPIIMLACLKDIAPHPAWFFRVSMETDVVSVHPTLCTKLLPETEPLKPAVHSQKLFTLLSPRN